MDDLNTQLRALLEREAIEDVLLRYASTIDTKDYATLRTLFCDDIHGEYGPDVVDGADELIKWIDAATADVAWQHHLLTVYHIDLVSETEAKALTYHTSHQIKSATPDRRTKIVARYRDTLRKEADGKWRIADKFMEIGFVEERAIEGPRG
jgi:ketosteroid isomerase-like protein